MRLGTLAPGKVNLCLFLGGTRPDGRHELVTLFESVSLADELSVSTIDGPDDEVICPGVREPNLVSTALQGLRNRGWNAPPVRVEVHKRLPVAAGMGGGSADAAAVLRLAPALAPVPEGMLAGLAAGLGADVPSQLTPGLALGTGTGEIVEPLAPLGAHAVLIVPSPGGLATASVYREADRLGLSRSAAELSALRSELSAALTPGAELPARLLVNDLEPAAISLCPAIETTLAQALQAGAQTAIVCGSGPTVAGLFWGAQALDRAEAAARALRGQFPGAQAASPVTAAAAEAAPIH